MAQSADDLQWAMGFKEMFSIYCTQWKQNVNVEKTQQSLFFKRSNHEKAFLLQRILEMIKNSNILVLYFPEQGHFNN